jgi:D-alanyl-D-alanine dipeptidase
MKRFIFLILLFNLFSCSAQNKLPEGFDYVTNHIPDVVLELRYFGNDNFVGRPINGYNKNVSILSTKAILALKNVQKELNEYNLGIKVFDSYRPQQAVDHFVRWAKVLNDTINKQKFYPNIAKKNLFKEGYIASKSGHTRGSTIDLTLVDLTTGKELDMGSPWDFFGPESWVANVNLTKQQRANRMLLQTVMRKHGFKHYTKEWWHFTLANEPFPETYFNFPVR